MSPARLFRAAEDTPQEGIPADGTCIAARTGPRKLSQNSCIQNSKASYPLPKETSVQLFLLWRGRAREVGADHMGPMFPNTHVHALVQHKLTNYISVTHIDVTLIDPWAGLVRV